eukprot:905732_1
MDSIHCSFYHWRDIDRINTEKYTLKATLPKLCIDDSGTRLYDMEDLWHYLCDIGKYDVIISTWSIINSEEYDSESLLYYVNHTKDNNKSQIATELEEGDYRVIWEFFDSLPVSDPSFCCFSIGYRFYYWKHYQNIMHQELEQKYVHNDHSGYEPHQLFVQAKYPNLKDELLTSKAISLDAHTFAKLMRKAEAMVLTKEARLLKAAENQLLRYGIKPGSPIELEHLMSIILYCDYTKLCTAFSASFRRLQHYEHIEMTIRRNAEYANWSRRLREVVELYGKRGWEKREHDEAKWNESHNRIKGPFYCGMDQCLVVPEFNIRLCAPTSTSTDSIIANKFATDLGTVLQLNNTGHWHSDSLRIFDCKWISHHSREDEKLMIGGLYTIKVQGIIKRNTKQKFTRVFEPLFWYDCMVTGVSVRKHKPIIRGEQIETLDHLISWRLNSKHVKCREDIDQYIYDTFKAFTNHKKQIVINLYQIHIYFEKIRDLVISKWIKPWNCSSCRAAGNSVNSARCYSCQALPPRNVHGINNLLQPTLFQVFRKIKRIVVYTTSGNGEFEYAFDLVNWLDAMTKCAPPGVIINIKASHRYEYDRNSKKNVYKDISWLSKRWKQKEIQAEWNKKARVWSAKLSSTKTHGGQVNYKEDTLTIIHLSRPSKRAFGNFLRTNEQM